VVTFVATIPALPARDVERGTAFYRDILGFEPVLDPDGNLVTFWQER
jgi:catechol 2,3-dioxygenase-like lactoylglutathione lyase family enzyme